MKEYLYKKINEPRFLVRAIVCFMSLITICFCGVQFLHSYRCTVVRLSDYPEIDADWEIDDIHWKDPDYDYITGRLSIDGSEMTTFPTKIVFYNDTDDVAFALPLKLSKNVPVEKEQENLAENDLRNFIYHDVEYIYNAGENAADTVFYCLINRDNVFRNYFKIAFIINKDDSPGLVKTDLTYKYMNME